jgi:hypothetical protein
VKTDRQVWQESNETLARILRGEHVPDSELPHNPDPVDCRRCRDTGFRTWTDLHGVERAARCEDCREKRDAAIRKAKGKYVPGTEEIGDDPPPPERDWKRLAGPDGD